MTSTLTHTWAETPQVRGDSDRIIKEWSLQVSVQDAVRTKTVHGMHMIAHLHREGAITKETTFRLLTSFAATADFDSPYDQIWADSMRQQILDFIDQIHKCIRLGAMDVAREIERTLYLPPHEPGLMERLLTSFTGGRR